MTALEKITEYLSKDTERLAEIIEKHPQQVPVPVIADWWGCDENSLRDALQQQRRLKKLKKIKNMRSFSLILKA